MLNNAELLIVFVMIVVTIITKEYISEKAEVIVCIGFLGGNIFCLASRIKGGK